jgi:hypothetical protein
MDDNSTIATLLQSRPRLTSRPETSADRLAARNWLANSTAIAVSQPQLAQRLQSINLPLTWTFGRDGYLTAQDNESNWLTGCSVPLAAGQRMFRHLEVTGVVGCFLRPEHAGQLRAAFEKISRKQAIIAVTPDINDLAAILRCDDFSPEIRAGRLYFVAGEDWPTQLENLFREHPGLPTPQQFIRTPLLEEFELNNDSALAQPVIAAENTRRSDQISKLLESETPAKNAHVLVVAGSQFNLANLAGITLQRVLADDNVFVSLDADDPNSASALSLAIAASQSSAVIAADVFRCDSPNIVSPRIPWITWVTNGRIPAPDSAAEHDSILLADPTWQTDAIQAGWPKDRISIASWPEIFHQTQTPPGSLLGFFADTCELEPPAKINGFSSHLLLWEMIREELLDDCKKLGHDPEHFLKSRMAQLNIREAGFDRQVFAEQLILPAYQQGLAQALVRAGKEIVFFGEGWDQLAEFKKYSRGPIRSFSELTEAIQRCGMIVNPSPLPHAQPAHAFGLPVLSGHRIQASKPLSPLARGKVLSMIPGKRWPILAADRSCD